ncbi:helix-turn-helix domain-containing protein [Rhodanobacter glycinis]|uniref:Helix-turn-helix domain-containing protein n=1 Tax=Rhodanobacter glycinis TaxID=582702 RepID=A0A502F619_9GAMM|nr:helix-turn-helix domain-containing protein [Rhodanobacter glycinis]TPG08509.1 helix-turn-helix domain-containing protein [Rhodanobacter glycinis]TPG44854.1 helix-turn-helix domain-containing protein [Rhodanobacter glycinis]
MTSNSTSHVEVEASVRAPIHHHFSTCDVARTQQLVAWRDQTSSFLDIAVSHAQVADGFRATLDHYRVDGMTFLHACTDPITQTRTAPQISTDTMRDYVFHVLLAGGCVETTTGLYPRRKALQSRPGILALDMGQSMRMEREYRSQVMALFLPRALVESVLPDAESLHGRVIDYASPRARMFLGELEALSSSIDTMSGAEARSMMATCAQLIVGAFAKQCGLSGDARAAIRAAVFGRVRRHVEHHLHEPELSLESIVDASRLSRAALYRLFEHEGGLATYIRNRRLREAADELIRFPKAPVVEIAYGLGFRSAADFNHAFRRAYDMPPRDFRALARARESRASGQQSVASITP